MKKYDECAPKVHWLHKFNSDGGMLARCGEMTILRKDSITVDLDKVNCWFCLEIMKQEKVY